jgi:predicted nucleic acid-binding Zn ribbon protein
MAKSKNTRKLSTSQIVFYALCALVVFSMVLAAVAK